MDRAKVHMTKKKIGIKYCGGCNPTYERVEVIQRVQSSLGDRFLFLRHDQKGLDLLILANGCPRACADQDLKETRVPCRSVTAESEFDSLVEWLAGLDRKGD